MRDAPFPTLRALHPDLLTAVRPPLATVSDDHRRLGWAVVDIRAVKQNALEPAPGDERAGAWLKLSSAAFQTDKARRRPRCASPRRSRR